MFQIQTKTVVQSATVELDGASILELAEAAGALAEARVILSRSSEARHGELASQLEPVQALLSELRGIVQSAAAVESGKVRKQGGRRPRSAAAQE